MLHRCPRLPTLAQLKHAVTNRNGSEALELVYSTAAVMVFILCTMMILAYALQVNSVIYAAKRVTRYIEVGGTANQADLNNLLAELLPNSSKISATVSVDNVRWFNASSRKIQLRDRFRVVLTASYNVQLMSLGGDANVQKRMRLKVPIVVKVAGQSEVYWKK